MLPCGYAVVDLEATGPSPRRHRVLEVAVVLLDAQCRTEHETSTLLDPEGPVGPTHIHGIVRGDTAGAPRFAQIAARLLALLAGRILVGHNVGCDRSFLAAEFARLGTAFPRGPELCTMRLAQAYLPALPGHSLRACCAAAGLADFPAHTALGDARATAALLAHYAGRHPARTADGAWAAVLAEAVGAARAAGAAGAGGPDGAAVPVSTGAAQGCGQGVREVPAGVSWRPRTPVVRPVHVDGSGGGMVPRARYGGA
ncbi:3'-5' exonuclease [Streptomyces sp. HB2AG]|uniref:3'-5' exonuclease n=1 Tax=Streptomyces sp. HB2AG TaxID=2983400 RepID=UPI0022AACCF7|nr:3'-5' exonuclease [Streptomyces sp. HB2AG]MCZ2524974.1 3'-5' exonuclease [Streptomyces sp. HB2AG]